MQALAAGGAAGPSPLFIGIGGACFVVLALGNVGLLAWGRRQLREGDTLWGTLRWAARRPKLTLCAICAEFLLGVFLMTTAVFWL